MLGKKLSYGDTIGIIAPASFADIKKLNSAKKNLEELGFKVEVGESTKSKWFTFSGTDEIRANDINKFFNNPKIDAIITMRGGYGSIKLLDKIDYEIIKNNPKIFVGYSDITTLHTAIFNKTGLLTFHGPMATSNFSKEINEFTLKSFLQTLMHPKEEFYLKNPTGEELIVISEGKNSGKIIGGNLITLISNIGTEYDFDYNDKILFIEDIGEVTYKVDRALAQLKNIGVFSKVNGIIIGDFNDCKKDCEDSLTLFETFQHYFANLNIPVICNLKSGHCEPMVTLPLGANCEIDTYNKTIKILEKVVK
ncbi:MAG: LD-carboxypeptidase [Cetobacterium sp.]|uniref:S66 peptidase family protein n=1 Tax=Cetobacterium sp. TaxID=2071632 RepID=UPI002FC89915